MALVRSLKVPRHGEPSLPVVSLMAGKRTPTADAFARVVPILGWLPTEAVKAKRVPSRAGVSGYPTDISPAGSSPATYARPGYCRSRALVPAGGNCGRSHQ